MHWRPRVAEPMTDDFNAFLRFLPTVCLLMSNRVRMFGHESKIRTTNEVEIAWWK